MLTDDQKRTRLANEKKKKKKKKKITTTTTTTKKLLKCIQNIAKRLSTILSLMMRPGFTILTKAEVFQPNLGHKNARRPIIAKRPRMVKKVLYVIFFENNGAVMQILMLKGRTVTAKFY